MERGDKRNLPTGLKQVAYARSEDYDTETEEEIEERMEQLYKDIEQAVRLEEYNKALEMAKRYRALQKILEQPENEPLSRIDKLKVAMKKVGEKLEELRKRGSEAFKQAERKLEEDFSE
jgi:hypothetical protein